MFITLSRRNTSLVNQQLRLIESLEKDEEDARRLESLFRLDHLAARMRRTADSLLVLADAPTHTTADDDLTVASALQAASAGVQDYQRVRVGSTSPARISDAASADIVHLLTELVDNALALFRRRRRPSSSARRPAPRASSSRSRTPGSESPTTALAEINETLHRGGDVTPDTARRMGLFVVSRLAQRHGVTVSLARNASEGITASVLLPNGILEVAPPATTSLPPPPQSAERGPARAAHHALVAGRADARRRARCRDRLAASPAGCADSADDADTGTGTCAQRRAAEGDGVAGRRGNAVSGCGSATATDPGRDAGCRDSRRAAADATDPRSRGRTARLTARPASRPQVRASRRRPTSRLTSPLSSPLPTAASYAAAAQAPPPGILGGRPAQPSGPRSRRSRTPRPRQTRRSSALCARPG